MGRTNTAPTPLRSTHRATTHVPDEPPIVPVVVLLGGLTTGLLAQGGFYGAARIPLFLAVTVAVGQALHSARPSRVDLRLVPASVAAVLGGWALLRGLPTDDPGSGVPMAALLAAVAAVLLVVRRQGQAGRELLLAGLLGAGVLVSTVGWAGVVWHRTPWALSNDGVWRAASTLTYANATAAVLVPLFLVSLGLLVGRPLDAPRSVVTALLLIGAGATLSRAGTLSLVAGLLVLSGLCGVRRLVVAGLAPVAGAGVAVGGLVMAMPLSSAPHQVVPIVALPTGLAVAAALGRWSPSRRGLLLLSTTLPVAVLVLARTGAVHRALGDVALMRANASSRPGSTRPRRPSASPTRTRWSAWDRATAGSVGAATAAPPRPCSTSTTNTSRCSSSSASWG